MEQLVHLRLKSIYKAFKQSSSSAELPTSTSISTLETHDLPPVATAKATKATTETTATSLTQHGDESFERETAKAEAAAAALLAELDQEEEHAKSRKSKKKRKKERQKQAKKTAEEGEEDSPTEKPAARRSDDTMTTTTNPEEQQQTDKEDSTPPPPPTTAAEVSEEEDPLEQELWDCVADSDIGGVETLLLTIKGVPGRAVLRKNAKKALKKLRQASESAKVKDSSSAAAIAPTIDTTATSDLLSVVSMTHKSPRSECVLRLAPIVVGWVIGKGGQRIRDLMEESGGAKIWIDRRHEPRLAHVSGSRASVETAVRLIQNLVQTESAETAGESSSLSPSAAVSDEQQQYRRTSPHERQQHRRAAGDVKHIMTCDARFVPLLIGRRGWTIKHIQDSSLAWVDIDQSVTPRKITISGKQEHVDIAVGMVRDILSYPEAQLQGSSHSTENTNHEGGGKAHGTRKVDVPETKMEAHEKKTPTAPPPTEPVQSLESNNPPRKHPSPPSSLIMTTDAKSTVSASSSLSSTPEQPSNAAAKSNGYVHVSPTNMLPPMQGPYSAASAELQASSIEPNPRGQAPMAPFPGFSTTESSNQDQYLRTAAAAPMNKSLLPSGTLGTSQTAPAGQRGEGFVAPTRSFGEGPAMYPPPQAPPKPFVPPHAGLQSSSNHTLSSSQHHNSTIAGGLWEQQPSFPSAAPTTRQRRTARKDEGFRLDAAVDFLQHSREAQGTTTTTTSQMPESTISKILPAAGVDSGIAGRDDSVMVDSLFGPTTKGSVVSGSPLLSGLRGLSLGSEKNPLWGSSAEATAGERFTEASPSSLFSEVVPPTSSFATSEPPSHSRFAWGE